MKLNISLSNPIIVKAMEEYKKIIIKALEVPQTVESAVYPIYHLPEFGKKLMQIASGVLVKIKSEYFILSASHVFDDIGNHQLLTGDGTGTEVQSIIGDRFSSGRGISGTHSDDDIDASAFHIKSPISDTLKKSAITFEDFDLVSKNNSSSIYIAVGFRVNKSNTIGNVIRSKREGYPSIEIREEDYLRNKINADYSIALAYENEIMVDGVWQLSPKPKGFSGGAIIRIDGLNYNNSESDKSNYKQLLSGIVIEQRRGKNNEEGVLIGTRIGVHLALIEKYLPDLFDNI